MTERTSSRTARYPLRVAMWSGPRNVSTALMRAWENRGDAFVWDEPFYGFYLARTGAPHPGAAEVIARHGTDWRAVVEGITGPVPDGRPVFYQKHMAHHLLPEISREWLPCLEHCFLIRHPKDMLLSLDEKIPDPRLEDTGLSQQWEIFEAVRHARGKAPPVIDSKDLLAEPRRILEELCAALGLDFSERMLSWPPGRRETDGVWAKHWYHNVEKSTGFAPYRRRDEKLRPALEDLYARCMPYYDRLRAFRLKAD